MNNKGHFKDEGSLGKRITRFFKESGFYIAIVVGLCALAAGAVFFSTNQILTDPNQESREDGGEQNPNLGIIDYTEPGDGDLSSDLDANNNPTGSDYSDDGPISSIADGGAEDEPGESVNSQTDITPPEAYTDPVDNPTNDQGPVGSNDGTGNGTQASDSEDLSVNSEDVALAVAGPNFQSPITGKVQMEFSMDKLVYSPTFNEWRTHSGVDLAAARGEAVRAVGNGVVLEIKSDPRYGFTVVIDHKNGYKSLYANLASDKTLQVGQEVKQGDTIGAVGATAIFESAEPSHLHFELYKENKLVDPSAYIQLTTN